jgi:hypothetical protein
MVEHIPTHCSIGRGHLPGLVAEAILRGMSYGQSTNSTLLTFQPGQTSSVILARHSLLRIYPLIRKLSTIRNAQIKGVMTHSIDLPAQSSRMSPDTMTRSCRVNAEMHGEESLNKTAKGYRPASVFELKKMLKKILSCGGCYG